MFLFTPKDTVFDHIEELNGILLAAGEELLKLPDSFPNSIPERAVRIVELEKQAKELRHRITEEINRAFVTPLDREDLHMLALRLEDILDHAGNAVSSLGTYRIKELRPPLPEFCTTINNAIQECVSCVRVLRRHKKLDHLSDHLRNIRSLEQTGDELLREALRELFDNEDDAREIIKWKDIFQSFEKSLDRAEDVADVLESILIKNT